MTTSIQTLESGNTLEFCTGIGGDYGKTLCSCEQKPTKADKAEAVEMIERIRESCGRDPQSEIVWVDKGAQRWRQFLAPKEEQE